MTRPPDAEMASLIERLENASGPDQELDAEIWLTLNPDWREYPRDDRAGQIGWQTPRAGRAYLSSDYTASIDEALMREHYYRHWRAEVRVTELAVSGLTRKALPR